MCNRKHRAAFLIVWLTSCAIAQSDEGSPESAIVDKQIEVLIEQQNKLADDYNKILREIKQNEELVALNTSIAAAKARLSKAEAENKDLAIARQGEQEAREAVAEAVEQKLKEHGEGAQLLRRLEYLNDKRAEMRWQVAHAQFQMNHALSPINRTLAADAELAAAKAKMDAAGIDERSEAKAAYDLLRSEKLDEIVEAQRLLATIDDAGDAAQRAQESIVAVEERLAPIRKQIERIESKRIEAARDKVAEALNSEAIVSLRKEVNSAVTQYNELITKLVAGNEDAVRLKAEYDEVRAKIKELKASSP